MLKGGVCLSFPVHLLPKGATSYQCGKICLFFQQKKFQIFFLQNPYTKTENKRIVALFLGDYLVSEGGLEPPRPNRAQGP